MSLPLYTEGTIYRSNIVVLMSEILNSFLPILYGDVELISCKNLGEITADSFLVMLKIELSNT